MQKQSNLIHHVPQHSLINVTELEQAPGLHLRVIYREITTKAMAMVLDGSFGASFLHHLHFIRQICFTYVCRYAVSVVDYAMFSILVYKLCLQYKL